MYIFVSILILVICVLLGLIVLVQNPKGGGLAANFTGAGSQFMGVRQTADFLEKSTWTLAVALLVLSLFSIFVIPRGMTTQAGDPELQELYQELPDVQPIQDFTPPPAEDNEEE